MLQTRISVGTNPVLITGDNPQRHFLHISMVPSSVEAGNTGTVFVGKGSAPSIAGGVANSGDPMVQGTQIEDSEQFHGDPSVYKGQWWAVADTAGQIIVVDEG